MLCLRDVREIEERLDVVTQFFRQPDLRDELENCRRGSLVGCRLWGRTESDTTEVT